MWEKYCGAMATSIAALDPVSRQQLRVFAFKLLIIIPVSVALAVRRGYPVLETISFFCFWYAVFSGAIALFQRQQPGAAWLTAWDEAAAFVGIGILARLLAAIMA